MTPRMSEDDLLASILDACARLRLRTAHFRPAWTERGYRTAVSGDGKGFPDLVIAGRRVAYRELKVGRNKPTAEQDAWLAALTDAGQDAGVWRETDWPEVVMGELRGLL